MTDFRLKSTCPSICQADNAIALAYNLTLKEDYLMHASGTFWEAATPAKLPIMWRL